MNVLGNAVHRMEEKNRQKKGLGIRTVDIPNLYAADMDKLKPEEGRILLNELTKVLHLNNINPEKYSLEFWAKYFNIRPQNLRNIFNYVSYPIVHEGEKKVVRVLRFIELKTEP
jgi:hypothetical protein